MSIREKLGLNKDKGTSNKEVKDDFVALEDNNEFKQTVVPLQGSAVSEQQGIEPGEFHREHVDTVQEKLSDEAALAAELNKPDPHTYDQSKQSKVIQMSGLAKNYLAASLDSLCRVPNAGLTESFRARLNTFREFIGLVKKKGVAGEVKIIASVVTVLAVDSTGKIDAITMLRQLVGQAMWLGSQDIARINSKERERDSQRQAPYGMDNMSDHSDAIAGIAGPDTNPTAEMTEEGIMGAVLEVHAVLSSMADLLPDNEDERIFLRLESGLAYTDEKVEDPAMPGGFRYEPVHDLDKAMDIQHVRNAESIKKREVRQAELRGKRLAALTSLYG